MCIFICMCVMYVCAFTIILNVILPEPEIEVCVN